MRSSLLSGTGQSPRNKNQYNKAIKEIKPKINGVLNNNLSVAWGFGIWPAIWTARWMAWFMTDLLYELMPKTWLKH